MKKQTIIAALLLATTMSHGKAAPNRTETPANYEGYLFAYFEGRGDAKQQEHLRFALSDDGVNWRALNGNRPVIASDTISESGVSATRTSCAAKTDASTSWPRT